MIDTYCGAVVVGEFVIYVATDEKLVRTVNDILSRHSWQSLKYMRKEQLATELITKLYIRGLKPLVVCDELPFTVKRVVSIKLASGANPDGWVKVYNTEKDDELRWRGTLKKFMDVNWKV